MAKLGASDINRIYAAYKADPLGQAGPFGSAILDWVTRCCYSVPEWLKADLVQDIVLEILTKVSTVEPRITFVKWVNGIVYNMRAACFRVNKYECVETPFSQLGQEDEDGNYVEFDPSAEHFEKAFGKDDEEDALPKGDREDAATRQLDAIRASFKSKADRDLLDLLRSGNSLQEAADAMGQSYGATQRRFARWKDKVAGKVSDLLHFPHVDSREGYSQAA